MKTIHRKVRARPVSWLTLSGVIVLLSAQQAWCLSSDNDQPMDVTAKYVEERCQQDRRCERPGHHRPRRQRDHHARLDQDPRRPCARLPDPVGGEGRERRQVFAHRADRQAGAHAAAARRRLRTDDADANTIDYKPPTNLAELTGNVKVVQAGRGESHSEHMLYNTDTGEMEAGDNSASSRVHMIMQPGTAKLPERSDNCGFPGTPKAKTAKTPAGETPAH
jgi:lipopolysaccharide export system protein LptA